VPPSLLAVLPPGLTASGLVFLLSVTFLAGLARGFSGFGGALIFMPLASIVVEPKLATAALLIADTAVAAALIPDAARTAERRDPGLMAAGAALGVPLGTAVLVRMEPVTLRWLISLTVLLLLGLLLSGWRYRGRSKPGLTLAVGFVSGLFSGAAQLGGPPVVAYLLGRDMPGRVIRAGIILFFAASAAISAIVYGLNGLLTLAALGLAAVVAPVFSLGLFCGARLFGRASERLFRTVCYSLIAGAAIAGLPMVEQALL
jgi:uncharacterized membrane protein YfcA